MLESTPPDKYEPTGTSAFSRLSTALQHELLEFIDQAARSSPRSSSP